MSIDPKFVEVTADVLEIFSYIYIYICIYITLFLLTKVGPDY